MAKAAKQEPTTADLLSGKRVILCPYAPGFLARDVLWRVWKTAEDDGAIHHLLYGAFQNPAPENVTLDPRGNLDDFMRAIGKPDNLILVVRPREEDAIIGVIWFSDIVQGLRANANIWIKKGFRRLLGLEAGWLALRYAFVALELRDVWAATPWENVATYARRLGFEPWVELPEYQRIDGELHPMRLLRLRLEQFTQGGK